MSEVTTLSGVNRFRISAATGLVIGLATGAISDRWPVGLLVVVIATATLYVVWAHAVLWRMDPERTQVHAGEADVDDEVGDLVLLLILVASLTSVGILLLSANDADKASYAGMSLAAILTAWSMLHTMYAARYARLYYDEAPGGIDFNVEPPDAPLRLELVRDVYEAPPERLHRAGQVGDRVNPHGKAQELALACLQPV